MDAVLREHYIPARTFCFNYVDMDEATPRTEFTATIKAEDEIDAALTFMGECSLEGTKVSVYNMIEMQD